MRFIQPLWVAMLVIFAGGCQSSSEHKPPVLGAKNLLSPNVGDRVTIIGTAQYNSEWGPSVVGGDFELPVLTDKPWGDETKGKRVEVIGRLNSRIQFEKPPLRDLGDYWLSDATWSAASSEKK